MRVLAVLGLCGAAVACGTSSPTTSTDAGVDAGFLAPYTQSLLDDARIGSDSSQPNFQKVKGEFALKGGTFASVKLVVDLTSTCYPWDKWTANPPPSGQSWPTDCDAFDRNFELAVLDPANPDAPGLELIRAITPFGGPEHLEADVTDALNGIGGDKRVFQAFITTYSDSAGQVSGSAGGWNVSAHFEVTPGDAPAKVLAVLPLTYFDDKAGGAETKLPFTLPVGTTRTRIEYRVTGHGGADGAATGCNAPADEFCLRTHVLTVDGAPLDTLKPWRTDCKTLCTLTPGSPFGDYCLENPCGLPASVRAPRANWCPGSETKPFAWEPALTEGPHTFGFTVDKIAGQWRVSATVYAFGD